MWQAILSGLTLGLILALSVGPVIFTIIKQSLNNGYAGGFSFVVGVWVSDIVLVVLGNAFSELMLGILEYKKAIAYFGSTFLLMMGIFYVFFKKVTLKTDTDEGNSRFRKRDMAKIFTSGFLINTLNPQVFLFWLTWATIYSAKFSLRERITVFSICIAFNMLADALKVITAGKLRKKLTFRSLTMVNKVAGIILMVFGLVLLYGVIFYPEKLN